MVKRKKLHKGQLVGTGIIIVFHIYEHRRGTKQSITDHMRRLISRHERSILLRLRMGMQHYDSNINSKIFIMRNSGRFRFNVDMTDKN